MQISELRVYDDFIQERRVQLKEIRNDRNRFLKYISATNIMAIQMILQASFPLA
jgi:hypothetical protein